MLILNLWGEIRELFLRLDMVAFSFIDNIYSLFTAIASESLISETIVKQVLNNVYVLVGIFAFFRIAVLLINSIINPDALNKQGAGLSKIFVNTVIMLVLLVFTPTLFQMSRDLSKEVVEGNYIQKLFININDSKNTLEPGKEMQRIAIGAVITPEEGFVDETGEITCSGDCEKALQCLNTINGVEGATGDECMKDNGVAWGKLADYNGIREKDANGEKVYVYNYKPLVLTVVGWTITYILLSFTFDVAKRMIELAILEIVSPLFIATIVDPKSMQTGPFKKWLKTLGNSYGGLFLRIAAISIMLLCVRLLSYWHPAAEIGGFGKLIVLIAFLIFIRQLPKWFSNMLGMDGDGTGLGDLGIGKKIGGAALIGGLATKAGHGLAGAAPGILRGAGNHLRNKKDQRNGIVDKALGNDKKERRKARRDAFNDNGVKGWFSSADAQRKGRKAAIKNAKDSGDYKGVLSKEGWKQGGVSMAAGAIGGFTAGAKADNLKAAFGTGKIAADKFKGKVGMQGSTLFDKIKSGATDFGNKRVENAFGNDSELREAREAREFSEKVGRFVKPEYRNIIGKDGKKGELAGAIAAGPFNDLEKTLVQHGITDKDQFVNAVAAMALNPDATITGFNGKELTFSNGRIENIEKGSAIAGRVFNDAGMANIEQMYLNKGNQVLSEREQYNSTIKSTQSAINEAIAANTALRAFSVNMPDGGKLDLSFRTTDELAAKIAQAKTKVDSGSPKEEDYMRETRTTNSSGNTIITKVLDKDAFESAKLDFQKNSAIYDSLIRNESAITQNIEIANNNDLKIQSDQDKIKELEKIIKDQKMDEVVEALAKAVKVDNAYNVEGIREGVSKETSKTSERIKSADKNSE